MKRKKQTTVILSAILCFVCLAISFAITYAYLVDRDNKGNSFIVGETTTTITEEFVPPKKLVPGGSFKKEPKVENTGNLPCFVRMRADFSDSKMRDICDVDFKTAPGDDWEYNAADEYYYYKHLLQPGEVTSALFSTVTVKDTATEAQMKDFEILVYSESKQHIDHAEENHPTDEYKTIWG